PVMAKLQSGFHPFGDALRLADQPALGRNFWAVGLPEARTHGSPLSLGVGHLRTGSGHSYFALSLLQWLPVCSSVNGLSTVSSRWRPGNVFNTPRYPLCSAKTACPSVGS